MSFTLHRNREQPNNRSGELARWQPPCSEESDSSSTSDDEACERANRRRRIRDRSPLSRSPSVPQCHLRKERRGRLSSDDGWRPPTLNRFEEKDIQRRRYGGIELQILKQPEEQHRARYMSEGSRGAVKDRSGKSYVTVKLCGYQRPTVLEIFTCMNDEDQILPHPYYKAIPVTGKGTGNNMPCRTRSGDYEGLEVDLKPEDDMTAVLDCLGILKVCGYKVKQSRGIKGRSSCSLRLVFRTQIDKVVGGPVCEKIVLETVSTPILCVQQLGQPEIIKMSSESSVPYGGNDLFIIGRNFAKNCSVIFTEVNSDGKAIWSAQADIQKEFSHQCHLVCTVPTYRDLRMKTPVKISVVVQCGNKSSRPMMFHYIPGKHDQPLIPHVRSTTTGGFPYGEESSETEMSSTAPDLKSNFCLQDLVASNKTHHKPLPAKQVSRSRGYTSTDSLSDTGYKGRYFEASPTMPRQQPIAPNSATYPVPSTAETSQPELPVSSIPMTDIMRILEEFPQKSGQQKYQADNSAVASETANDLSYPQPQQLHFRQVAYGCPNPPTDCSYPKPIVPDSGYGSTCPTVSHITRQDVAPCEWSSQAISGLASSSTNQINVTWPAESQILSEPNSGEGSWTLSTSHMDSKPQTQVSTPIESQTRPYNILYENTYIAAASDRTIYGK